MRLRSGARSCFCSGGFGLDAGLGGSTRGLCSLGSSLGGAMTAVISGGVSRASAVGSSARGVSTMAIVCRGSQFWLRGTIFALLVRRDLARRDRNLLRRLGRALLLLLDQLVVGLQLSDRLRRLDLVLAGLDRQPRRRVGADHDLDRDDLDADARQRLRLLPEERQQPAMHDQRAQHQSELHAGAAIPRGRRRTIVRADHQRRDARFRSEPARAAKRNDVAQIGRRRNVERVALHGAATARHRHAPPRSRLGGWRR